MGGVGGPSGPFGGLSGPSMMNQSISGGQANGNMGASMYNNPFSQSNNNTQNNWNAGQESFPQLPGMHRQGNQAASQKHPNDLSFTDLSPQQQKFFSQIQSHLLQTKLSLSLFLSQPPFSLSPLATFLSRSQLSQLGTTSHADPLDPSQLDDLSNKLKDPSKPQEEHLLLDTLRRLLDSSQNQQQLLSPRPIKPAPVNVQSIKNLMASLNKPKVTDVFSDFLIPDGEGDQLVGKEPFVNKLKIDMLYSEEEAQAIVAATVSEKDTGKVSMKRLDELINKPVTAPEKVPMNLDKAQEILNQTFEHLKRFIAMNEVNMVDLFLDIDEGDGYSTREELSKALERCRFETTGPAHEDRLEAIFLLFDQQKLLKIDQMAFINRFYQRANEKRVGPGDSLSGVFEGVRKYMAKKKFLSIAAIFLDDYYVQYNPKVKESIQKNLPLVIDSQKLFIQLTKELGISELESQLNQQRMFLTLKPADNANYGMIDYQKFADLVGYQMPKGTDKESIRKMFYRVLMKDLGPNVQQLENMFVQADTMLSSTVDVPTFQNIILSVCPSLLENTDWVRIIPEDFLQSSMQHQVVYSLFIGRLQREYQKQNSLHKVYLLFYELLMFKESTDLYDIIFRKFDQSKERKFSRQEIHEMLMKNFAIDDQTAARDTQQFFFEFEQTKKPGHIKYSDIEVDFREYVDELRKNNRLPQLLSLPNIFRMIQKYTQSTGKTLRQVFGKSKSGSGDTLNQFEFQKIIEQIGDETRVTVDKRSMGLISNMISIAQPATSQTSKHDIKQVSFRGLQQIYNEFFHIQGEDNAYLLAEQLEGLLNHITKVILENAKNKFNIRNHFILPQCNMQRFVSDLMSPPFSAEKEFPIKALEELGSRFPGSGLGVVNTNQFCFDLEAKVLKLRDKERVLAELKNAIVKKNTTIERAFAQALPEVSKFDIDHLSGLEFFHVFLFLECANVTEQQVRDILNEFYSQDDNGKFSVKEFIKQFQVLYNVDPKQARRGRRLYTNLAEILKRISFVISGRGLKNFGTLLADHDLEGKSQVLRDAFYRTIDSLQFGLGEGDILELIKTYAVSSTHVDIFRFKEDLNQNLIETPEFRVELKSVLNGLVGTRVVDVIEEEAVKNLPKIDAKTMNMFKVLTRDMLSGLYLKDADVVGWFPKYGTFKKGCLTNKEFFSAVESLDAISIFDKNAENLVQQYYDFLVARQQNSIGYSEPLLLIDQLNILFNKDTGTTNRGQIIENILSSLAVQLTDQRLPIGDILKQYDPQNTGMMYKSDFSTLFLDNYLHLQPKLAQSGALSGLTHNMKLLLSTRYCPVPSQLNFKYENIIDDLKRKEAEAKGSIKIYLTKQDVEEDESVVDHEEQDNSFARQQPVMPSMIELPAKSKRNTHVTALTVTKQFLKGSLPLASYMFDDVMIGTFQKGLSVETHFLKYSRPSSSDFVLGLDDFNRALQSLNLDWGGNLPRIAEFFNSLDLAAHQGQLRYVSTTDIGEAIFLNASKNVDDIISEHISAVHKALKEKNMLGRLRDLFNFINSQRDETCEINEFKRVIKEIVENGSSIPLLNEHKYDQITMRYKVATQPNRLDFSKFLKDIEYCELGILPSQIWAIDLATNIMKAVLVNGFDSYEKVFVRYTKMTDSLIVDDFKRAMEELKLQEYHPDSEIRDFFAFVQAGQGGPQGGKVTLTHLVNSLKRLAPKSIGLLIQTIFEKLWAETKKNNLSFLTVKTTFTSFDLQKSGFLSIQDFNTALKDRLKISCLTSLDIQVLSKRYTAKDPNGTDSIQYDKFFTDYQRFEKLGLQAGYDPLKEQGAGSSGRQQGPVPSKPLEQNGDSKALYAKLATYCQRSNIVDKICDALVQKDAASGNRGCLSFQHIKDIFQQNQMTLNTKQMNDLLQPVPTDPLDGAYYYLILIELAFGRQQAQQVQAKQKLQLGTDPSRRDPNQANKPPAVMTQRFREQIEVKLSTLQAIIHQITKGSYLLTESEFTRVFRQAGITVSSQDHDLLTQSYQQLRHIQTQAIDFRAFVRHQGIKETAAQVISALQKVIAEKNIHLTDEDGTIVFPGKDSTVSLVEFNEFMAQNKIELPGFTPAEIDETFHKITERQQRMPKSLFVRILKGERDVNSNQEWLPYIVNEFIYHLINNQLNIFKFVNPQARVLSTNHFETLLEKLRYKPSNPKDMGTLIAFFTLKKDESPVGAPNQGMADGTKYISIDKILEQARKLAPDYALIQTSTVPIGKPAQQQANNRGTIQNKPQQTGKNQFESFNQRIKDILAKINDSIRREGIMKEDLFHRLDQNNNGAIEKLELLNFFSKEVLVKGLNFPDDIEILFDALDTNRDGLITVNEFCLCIEGIQKSIQERLKSFDPDLEKALQTEINQLFDFFDTNKDSKISFDELQIAIKSQNPYASPSQIQQILKETDKNNSKMIEREEFIAIILPQMKLEIITNERNFDDLRRLFKQFDTDQNNFLEKREFREALNHLGINLSDVQLDDLMKEIDLDNNQVIDIDEFIAFLTVAEQVKFKNPANKSILIKIRHARKLQPMDFFNCFKNLPQTFQPSFTSEYLERKDSHTLSWGLYPQFDSKTLTYRELSKLEEVQRTPTKTYIASHVPYLASEITLEEALSIPMPKKEEFEWQNITNREVRACLVDMKTKEILSNVWTLSVSWKEDQPTKWQFQTYSTEVLGASGKQIMIKSQQWANNLVVRDVHLVFEFVVFTNLHENQQQVCCAWGSTPLGSLDKQTKLKLTLKGGSILQEQKINKEELFAEQKSGGFNFIKKLASSSSEEPTLMLSVKPFLKMTEQQQLYICMLPSTYIVNKKLLSFSAAFRLYCQQRLTKTQQQMLAPGGNFAIAQFRKVFDSPDLNLLLADAWDHHFPSDALKPLPTFSDLTVKLEDFLFKLYAVVHWEAFRFDHVYPTRSTSIDSSLFKHREDLVLQQLAPARWRKLSSAAVKKPAEDENKENLHTPSYLVEYQPFNIAEMEIQIVAPGQAVDAKADELLKLYQQLGLIMN